jgi:hypothetical protein
MANLAAQAGMAAAMTKTKIKAGYPVIQTRSPADRAIATNTEWGHGLAMLKTFRIVRRVLTVGSVIAPERLAAIP